MKIIKKLFIVIAVGLVAVLSACSKDYGPLFNEVHTNMEAQNNVIATVKIRFVKAEPKLIGETETIAKVLHNTEIKREIDLESATSGLVKFTQKIDNETAVEGYLSLDDSNSILYFKSGTAWNKVTSPISEEDTEIVPFLSVLKNSEKSKFLNEATVADGTKVNVYQFTTSNPELFNQIFGDDAEVFLAGLTQAEIDTIFDKVDILLSIDETTKLVRRIEIDLTTYFSLINVKLIEKNPALAEQDILPIPISRAYYTIDIESYGTADVTIPQTVIDTAVEVTE